jgi:hypothetical protein
MRSILTILFLSFLSHVYAGDTLTRAQVYNFNVGDTFDYRIQNIYIDTYYDDSTVQVSYSRYVVTSIYWSADTQTKYIVREQVFPAPIVLDTLVLTNVSGYEVVLDSAEFASQALIGSDTFFIGSTQDYFGRSTNYAEYRSFNGSPYNFNLTIAQGLGWVLLEEYITQVLHSTSDLFTILIYYSGDSGTYGTPYTSYHDTSYSTSVVDISANNGSLQLFPTLNNGTFTIETQDETQLPFDLSIYDLQGRKVSQLSISDKRKVIEIPALSDGVYIWKTSNNGTPLLQWQNDRTEIARSISSRSLSIARRCCHLLQAVIHLTAQSHQPVCHILQTLMHWL